MEKKTPLLHRIMWIYKQVILIIFFAILSILLQMLPMRLSGGTGVCISLTLYTSVCELMMVQRQQQQQHTHTHAHAHAHAHAHTHICTRKFMCPGGACTCTGQGQTDLYNTTQGRLSVKFNRSTKMIFHKQGQIPV